MKRKDIDLISETYDNMYKLKHPRCPECGGQRYYDPKRKKTVCKACHLATDEKPIAQQTPSEDAEGVSER